MFRIILNKDEVCRRVNSCFTRSSSMLRALPKVWEGKMDMVLRGQNLAEFWSSGPYSITCLSLRTHPWWARVVPPQENRLPNWPYARFLEMRYAVFLSPRIDRRSISERLLSAIPCQPRYLLLMLLKHFPKLWKMFHLFINIKKATLQILSNKLKKNVYILMEYYIEYYISLSES